MILIRVCIIRNIMPQSVFCSAFRKKKKQCAPGQEMRPDVELPLKSGMDLPMRSDTDSMCMLQLNRQHFGVDDAGEAGNALHLEVEAESKKNLRELFKSIKASLPEPEPDIVFGGAPSADPDAVLAGDEAAMTEAEREKHEANFVRLCSTEGTCTVAS